MITSAIIGIILDFMTFIFNLLPDSQDLPSNISSSLSLFSSYFSQANTLFPVSTMFQILSLGLTFEAVILLFKLTNFLLNKIRGSG